ncbi:Protein CBG12780 [Caenorhabditis briggsae]|uniref:Protein CBG12780 n=1 Tax=Caenorhabditis briggsae TaxID=6238 RepID=A8XGJ7_CAEBR|nr:Protein CBG12780 [Caenorhabditis briggsae]CAP31703.2 Protein CBG12780 [Caenorhabditis briggsae]
MLGSNLGKKVTAGVVQDQYKQFLKNKPEEKKKTLTPEERKLAKRAEMRKKGIFVKADDQDETPTIVEKIDGPAQPMIFVLPEKPTIWKTSKKRTDGWKTKDKKKEVTKKEKMPKSDISMSSGPQKKKVKKEKKAGAATVSSLPTSSSSATDQSSSNASKSKKSAEKAHKSSESDVFKKEEKPKPSSRETVEKIPEEKKKEDVVEPKKSEEKLVEKVEENKPDEPVKEPEPKVLEQKAADQKVEEKPVEKFEEKKEAAATPEPPKSVPAPVQPSPEVKTPETETQTPPTQPTPAPPPTAKAKKEPKENSKTEEVPLVVTVSNPSVTDSKKTISAPIAENQPDAFEKLDDDEFEKMTSDADEKEILKLAPRLLKVAKKHAAMEKCLTAEENEVLAKFFSGKQKLDATVLAVLDSALDKIIDYLQKNNCAVDDETKAVMKKRDKLKAAMMKEFLVSPQYLPKTWTAKFNEWKSEAEKQKNGINWFRVIFHYPKHKSFDDGPEDTFGNFHRRHRGLLMGIILGPGDVKSFEETKREDDCQGMFLDTKIIENANVDTKDTSSTVSERRTLMTTKSSKK